MLLNSWSMALNICSLGALFFAILASFTAFKVIRFWDLSLDTNRQIQLENETWLSATLMQYGLAFQCVSLLLLVVAADNFSHVITGAMCATGAFLANDYGVYALLVKLAGLFFYGFWIVVHRLDVASEYYPLVRIKYIFLLFLIPLIGVDISLQSLYLVNLEPDIITSCCGVVFKTENIEGNNLLPSFSTSALLYTFYGISMAIIVMGVLLRGRLVKTGRAVPGWTLLVLALLWLIFYPHSLVVITVVFSSYIYAMPYHHCPFDILQAEYNYVGYPIYFTLILGSFLGMSSCLAGLFISYPGLAGPVLRFQKKGIFLSSWLLLVFLLFSSYAPIKYLLLGGEY